MRWRGFHRARIYVYCSFLLINTISIGIVQSGVLSGQGSHAAGLAYHRVAIHNLWAVMNNQAGLAFMTKPAAGIYFENGYLLKELALKAMSVCYPLKTGALGLGYANFGYSAYHENKLSVAYGRMFGKRLAAGLALDYLVIVQGDGYTNRHMATSEIGALFILSDVIELGVHIFHPLPLPALRNPDSFIASQYSLGVKLDFHPAFLYAEAEKALQRPLIIRAGFEYEYGEIAFVRAGIQARPALLALGFGFIINKLQLDIAATMHQVLGISSSLSVTWVFK